MAIQHRRGLYDDYDPSKLVPGEWAIVLANDPHASDGRAGYICFAAGIVKRVATFEDMLDNIANANAEIVATIIASSTEAVDDVLSMLEQTNSDAEDAEQIRVGNEQQRITDEQLRVSSETERESAETLRVQAEVEREGYIEELKQQVEDGDLNGATYTPAITDDGVLSWTNDKSLPNPTSVCIKGEKGNDGVVTELSTDAFAFQVEPDGHLYLYCVDIDTTPGFEIDQTDGHLYVNID